MKTYTIRHRRGSTAEWEKSNSVLGMAEMGVEILEFGIRAKVGDGQTQWMNLPYIDADAMTIAIASAERSIEHADAGDLNTLTDANAYTDQQIENRPGPVIDLATASNDGLMPKHDKAKLDDYPANPVGIRFDTTAGIAIHASDGTTERVVSYDSGWRDMSSRLIPGLAKSTSYGVAKIKRENGMVYLVLRLDVSGAGITSVFDGSFPTGFRPDQVLSVPGILYSATVSGKSIASDQSSWYLSQTSFIRLGAAAPNPGTLHLTASWPTDAAIPGSLPGTPA